MTTAELTPQTQAALVRSEFRKQDAVIAELREKCTGMTVAKDGYKTVKAARIEVKNLRCSVENLRKDLKADVLERGKIIDEEAKRLTSLLKPIEDALSKEEEAEEARKAAEARANIEAEERRLQARIDAMVAINVTPDIVRLKAMSDEDYHFYYTDQWARAEQAKREAEAAAAEAARIAAEAEAIRLAQLEAERIERERLAALHAEEMARQAEELRIREAELAEQRKQIEAQRAVEEAERRERERIEQERIAAEQAQLAAEREILRKQQEEHDAALRAHAEEQASLKAIARKQIEDEEEAERVRLWNIEQEQIAAAEKARIEALLPEIELAESLQVYLGQTLSLWLERHGNRAWFGYAESEISSAALRIVDHVRKS
jgi:hypothetical protein